MNNSNDTNLPPGFLSLNYKRNGIIYAIDQATEKICVVVDGVPRYAMPYEIPNDKTFVQAVDT